MILIIKKKWLIFGRGNKGIQWKRDSFFYKSCWQKLDIIVQKKKKMKVDLYYVIHLKITPNGY